MQHSHSFPYTYPKHWWTQQTAPFGFPQSFEALYLVDPASFLHFASAQFWQASWTLPMLASLQDISILSLASYDSRSVLWGTRAPWNQVGCKCQFLEASLHIPLPRMWNHHGQLVSSGAMMSSSIKAQGNLLFLRLIIPLIACFSLMNACQVNHL